MNRSVKINEDHLNENENMYLDRAYCSKGVSQHLLHLADSKAGRGEEKALSWRKGKVSVLAWGKPEAS